MKLVVDASVVVKWFAPDPGEEPHHPRALQLLRDLGDGNAEAIQPPHWLAEVAAVLTRIQPDLADQAVGTLAALELPTASPDELPLYRRAIEISRRLEHHLFDTLYHALALDRGATLVTADRKYLTRCHGMDAITSLASYPLDPVGGT